MKLKFIPFLPLIFTIFSHGLCKNVSVRPSIVNIGAVFTFNSTVGHVANVAINAAVEDINSDPKILNGSKLVVTSRDSNCSGFLGIIEALQFMEMDIVAIIGPQCSSIAHIISSISNALQVPLLSFATDPTLSSLEFPFFVRTTHSDVYQMAAIADIIDSYGWKHVTAIYTDDEYGRNGIAVLDDNLTEKRCKISYKAKLHPSPDSNDILDMLVQVALMESRIIVVHVGFDGLSIFRLANHLQMMGNGYVWIATDWLTSVLDSMAPHNTDIMDNLQGVVALRQHVPDSKFKNGLVSRWASLSKKYGNGTALNPNAYGLYAYDSVWAFARSADKFFEDGGKISFSNYSILNEKSGGVLHLEAMSMFDQGNLMLDEIKKANFTGVTGQFTFDPNGELVRPAYDIINVVGTGWHTVGFWSNFTSLTILPPEELYNKPKNYSFEKKLYDVIWPGGTVSKPRGWVFPNNGKELRIGVPDRVSFQEFVNFDSVTGTFEGFCVDVFIATVALLPYPVPYRFVPFGSGKKNPNYTDLCNKVASNNFDAAIGDIAITMNRTRIVDFTQPYIDSGLVVLAPVKRQKSNAWAFLKPFTFPMWCLIGLFFVIVGVVIWILEHRINEEFRGPPKKQAATICWFSFSTLFFAHRENTMSNLGRAVLLIWLFVVLIIQSSYTASLTSILTVQQLSSQIQGIQSLISSNEPIGYQTGSFAEDYMVEELGIARDRLVELTGPEDYLRSLELGPSNGGVAAVVDERSYVELFLATECRFSIIGSEFTRSGWGFAFPRDSSLAVDMSTAILTLSENGDLQKIHDKWLMRSAACMSDASTEIEANQLHLDSFLGLFLICGVACIIALFIYLCITLRQYIRQVPVDERNQTGQMGQTCYGYCRSIKSFLSFADKKKEAKIRSVGGQKEMRNDSSTIDIED
ncbi:hypothetical protein LUZ60_009412 [Juncus effusus]|nr:hypothetical protein LUZ60_009412 [Juncus effusus]